MGVCVCLFVGVLVYMFQMNFPSCYVWFSFFSSSQEIGWEERLQIYLFRVRWDINFSFNQSGMVECCCISYSVGDVGWCHRHRIDKYLDTLLANQPISDGEATDHCQKVTSQDGRQPELIVARSCLTKHSEAASLWLVTRKLDMVGNHQWRHWRVVCCNVEDPNFGMQNLHPSNIKVIFQRPSCRSPIASASGFIAGTAPVVGAQLSGKHSCLIWSTSPENAQHLLHLTSESFVDDVNSAFVRCNSCRAVTGVVRINTIYF